VKLKAGQPAITLPFEPFAIRCYTPHGTLLRERRSPGGRAWSYGKPTRIVYRKDDGQLRVVADATCVAYRFGA
jgi:hypothetical protein